MPYSNDPKKTLNDLEVDGSVQPELHQMLRSQNFKDLDWRQKFAELREAKPIMIAHEKGSRELAECLKTVSGKSLFFSLTVTKDEDERLLGRLIAFLQIQGSILSGLLSRASACAVGFYHGEIRLDINLAGQFSEDNLSQRLDLERQRSGSMLHSFDYSRNRDWVSLTMNIKNKETESFEEISR